MIRKKMLSGFEIFKVFVSDHLNEGFTSNETEELEKILLPTAAFKEDTNMFSAEFREVFGF